LSSVGSRQQFHCFILSGRFNPLWARYKKLSYRWQTGADNRAMPVCKVVEVLQDFLPKYVDKKFTRDYNVILYLSIFSSFRVIRCWSQCVSPKISIFTTFVSPGDAPVAITQNVAWMKRQFSACQTPCSMYPSIFNSFPVIRTASSKNRLFHVPQPTFLFPLEMPLWLSRSMLHGWKDDSMLAKALAACTYLSSIVSELNDAEVNS